MFKEMHVNERGHTVLPSAEWRKKDTVSVIDYSDFLDVRPDHISVIDGPSSCGNCGEWLTYETVTDDRIQPNTDCPLVNGITSTYEINFPSGTIVVKDSLSPLTDSVDIDKLPHTYNSLLGQHECVLEYAKIGLAYGPVGNTCPGVYRRPDGSYVIANPAYNEDEDSDEESVVPEGWVEVASICTDLWAYSIADYDDYLARGGEPVGSNTSWAGPQIVDVEPGTYRFTHHTGEKDFDRDSSGLIIFAEFEKVGP